MQTNSQGDVILNIGANIDRAKGAMNNLSRDVRNVFKAFRGESTSNPALDKLTAQAEQSASKIAELQQKIRDMQNTFSDKPTAEMQRLIEKEQELEAKAAGIKDYIKDLKSYTVQIPGEIENAEAELRNVQQELSGIVQQQTRLDESGRAYLTIAQEQPQAFAQANEELRQEQTKLSDIKSKMQSIGSAGKKAADGVGKTFKKMSDTVSNGFKKIRSHAKTSASSAASSFNSINAAMKKGMRTLIKYGLGMRSFFVLFRKIRSAVVDGYKDLAENNEQIGASLKTVKDSASNLKMSIATAVEPLVTTFAPLVASVADKLASIMNSAGSFFAALTGQKYVYKAVKTQEEYADSLAETAENAGKAQKAVESYLSPLDDINRFTDNSDSSTEAGKTAKSVNKLATTTVPAKFQQMADTVKGYFSDLFKPIKTSWEKYGASALTQWHGALSTIKGTVGDILGSIKKVWTSGAGERLASNLINLFKTAGGIVSGIVSSFRSAWNKDGLGDSLIQSFTDKANKLLEFIRGVADTFKRVWNSGVGERIFSNILTIAKNINNIIGGFWGKLKKAWDTNNNGSRIWSAILGIVEKISGFIKDISGLVLDFIKKTDFSPILDALGTLFECFEKIVEILTDKFKDVFEQILVPLAKWTIEKAVPTIVNLLAKALEFLGNVISHIPIEVIKTLAGVIVGLWAAFKGYQIISSVITWISKLASAIGAFASFLAVHAPIAILLGIAAAIMAIVTAVQLANRQEWERSDLKQATDDINAYSESIKESADRINAAVDSVNKNTIELHADITQVEMFKQRLAEIIRDGVISAEEMPEYKTVIDFLNGIDGFSDKWNSINLKTINGEIHVDTEAAMKALDDWESKWKETQLKTTLQSSMSELGTTLISEGQNYKSAVANAGKAIDQLKTFMASKTDMSAEETEDFLTKVLSLIQMGKSFEAGQLLTTKIKPGDVEIFKNLAQSYLVAKQNTEHYADALDNAKTSYDGNLEALKYLNGDTKNYMGLLFLVENQLMSEQEALEAVKDTGIKSMAELETAAKKQAEAQGTASSDIVDDYKKIDDAVNGTAKNADNKFSALANSANTAAQNLYNNFAGHFAALKFLADTTVIDINDSLSNIGAKVSDKIRNNLAQIGATLGGGIALGATIGITAIPKLATGAVIPAGRPFMAMLGDQNAGRNLEAPESLIRQIVREETANISGGNNIYEVPVQVGRQTLFKLVLNEAELKRNQTGKNPFNMGGAY